MPAKDQSDSRNMLVEIARLYYEQQLTQTEIGRRMNTSRSTVSRLLQEARDTGIVTITIAYDIVRDEDLEQKLTLAFGLRDVQVLRSFQRNPDVVRNGMGQLAARVLETEVGNDCILGVSYGRSVAHVVAHVRPTLHYNVTIVPIIGALGSDNPVIEGIDLTHQLARKFSAKYRYLHAPLLVEDMRIRDLLCREPSVSEVIEVGKSADTVIVGIGALQEESSGIIWNGYINRKERDWLQNVGVVGHMCAQFFDIDGNCLDIDINRRTISIGLEALQGINTVIAIAGTLDKAQAILGALNGGYIDILITDDHAATHLLQSVGYV